MSVNTHPSLTTVATSNAAAAVGPYSQAVRVGDLLFLSGSLGIDPVSSKLVEGGVEAQTERALQNMKNIVEAGGSELGKIVKTGIFLANMDDFAAVNAIYTRFFGSHRPARTTVEVSRLPVGGLFEIDCIASLA